MKLELEKRSTKVFIGGLLLLALCINLYFWNHRSLRWLQPASNYNAASAPVSSQSASSDARRVDSQAEQRAAALAAAQEHARFLAQYVNSGFSRKQGINQVAVIAASEAGKIDRDLSQALSSRLKTSDSEMVGTFFKPELVSDGLLEQLFAESTELRAKLELDKRLDGLILARLAVEYVSNPSLEDVITAQMSLRVAVQSVGAGGGSKTWTLTASGAGFDRTAARAMAAERILKAISTDTKMSLAAVLAT